MKDRHTDSRSALACNEEPLNYTRAVVGQLASVCSRPQSN